LQNVLHHRHIARHDDLLHHTAGAERTNSIASSNLVVPHLQQVCKPCLTTVRQDTQARSKDPDLIAQGWNPLLLIHLAVLLVLGIVRKEDVLGEGPEVEGWETFDD